MLITVHRSFFLLNEIQFHELQVLQNRALRAVFCCDIYRSVDSMLKQLNLLDIKQRIYFNVLVMVHKMKLGLLPKYLCENLTFVRDIQPYLLRSNNLFRLPNFRTSPSQNSLFYKGVNTYNTMLTRFNPSDDLQQFKSEITNYVQLNFSSH